MILAQKPVSLPMSPPTSHRRHPSAPPAVIVQPTKVPGILSISKPLRTSSPRQHQQQQPHQRQHRSPKSKQPAPQNRSQLPHLTEASPTEDAGTSVPKQATDVTPAAAAEKKASTQPVTPTPDKSTRGRQTKQPKDKALTRSTSSHAHARRNNIRQPSPPIPSSQAEATNSSPTQSFAHRSNNPASNSFDPFIVSSDSDSDNSRPPIMPVPSKNGPPKAHPSLAAQPSGKLARRRHQTAQAPATPTPVSRAVPVRRTSTSRCHLSRSAPSNSNLASKLQNRRASTDSPAEFPICDDTTDVEDNFPTTPTREHSEQSTWQQLTLGGPRTAPLSSSDGFIFGPSAGVTPSPARRHHHRSPSEGVFNMSLDEDIVSTSDPSEELKKLFGFPPKRFGSVGPSATRTGKDKAGFFASSVFQNSPSPDELPPPAF